MAFEIVKKFVVKAEPQAVWRLLTDPERVASCLPGAAITGKLDDKTWQGTMNVKVGPVSSSYKGQIRFERLDEASMTAELSGRGQDTKGKGGADMKMKSVVQRNAQGETEVTATSTVNITGILAQMGRGMIQDVSDQMFQIFSQRLRAQLESAAPPPAPTAPPVPTAPTAPTAASLSTAAALTAGAEMPAVGAASAANSIAIGSAPIPPASQPPVGLVPSPKPEVLDVGAIGARAALRSPVVWIALIAAAAAVYFLFR